MSLNVTLFIIDTWSVFTFGDYNLIFMEEQNACPTSQGVSTILKAYIPYKYMSCFERR